jgi:hypothetical protein
MDPLVSVAEAGWYGGMPLLNSFMMDGMDGMLLHACMQIRAFRCKENMSSKSLVDYFNVT